jgi:hypothetical protein
MSNEERFHPRVWRFEIHNPQTPSDWQPLWQEFAEDQLAAAQELKDELNRINAPIQLRIVRNAH